MLQLLLLSRMSILFIISSPELHHSPGHSSDLLIDFNLAAVIVCIRRMPDDLAEPVKFGRLV